MSCNTIESNVYYGNSAYNACVEISPVGYTQVADTNSLYTATKLYQVTCDVDHYETSGYYKVGGNTVWRYWDENLAEFTSSGSCSSQTTTTTTTTTIAPQPCYIIQGPIYYYSDSSGCCLEITLCDYFQYGDTNDLYTTTVLYQNSCESSFETSGYYKLLGNTSWIYWNGTSFSNSGICSTTTSTSTTTTTTTAAPSDTLKKKFYYTFKSVSNGLQYFVEIWQKTSDAVTEKEIIGDIPPFKVSFPNVNNKFESIRGSGCDINIVSTTSMEFIDLYTSDMTGYQIKLYLGTGTTNLLWIGYLDSELYSEPFAEKDNYTVSLTGNDGLALLERIEFIKSDETHYTGFDTNWNIIKYILLKLGISWNNVYVYLTTTSSEVASGNILEKTYSNLDNYYDEDNIPMSCRDVLESILKTFGAYIQIINSNVYITDINNLAANNTATFYKYNGTSLDYVGTESINLNVGDVSTIKFTSSEQTLNIVSPINKQKITFSPYSTELLIDWNTVNDNFSGFTKKIDHGTTPYTWTEYVYEKSDYFTTTYTDRFCELVGSGENKDTKDKYLVLFKEDTSIDTFIYSSKIPKIIVSPEIADKTPVYVGDWIGNTPPDQAFKYNRNEVVTYLGDYYYTSYFHYPDVNDPPPNQYFTLTTSDILNPYSGSSIFYYLKIEAKSLARTYEDMGRPEGTKPGQQSKWPKVTKIGIKTQLRFNDKYFNGEDWTTSTAYFYWFFRDVLLDDNGDYQDNIISNKWVDLKKDINEQTDLIIPLFGFTGNDLSLSLCGIQVWGDRARDNDDNIENITDLIFDVRLKDIKFTILDEFMVEVENEDSEYISYINKQIKDDGSDITLYLGTNDEKIPTSKGGLIGYDTKYFFIKNFTRAESTDYIEFLLARSIASNYTNKTIEIQCSINIPNNMFGTLTYSNYWVGKKFMIIGADIDYHEDSVDVTIQEIFVDDPLLEIKKIF